MKAHLTQWKSNKNTTWTLEGFTKRDAVANYVEKKAIGSFMRWTLATIASPVIICSPNITVNVPSGKCQMLINLSGSNGATATGTPDPVISYSMNGKAITSPYMFPKGTTTVTATANNGIALAASCTFTVTVTCNNVTTSALTKVYTKEIQKPDGLTVKALPNPFMITLP